MDSTRAYRQSVVPFSVFLIAGGSALAVGFWTLQLPITSPFPFIESPALNRHLLGIGSLSCIGIGVGLLFRSQIAWFALLVYLAIGVLLPVISAWDAQTETSLSPEFPIIGSLLNGVMGTGLYLVLRPAFRVVQPGTACAADVQDPNSIPTS